MMSDLYIYRNTLRDLLRPKKLVAVALLVALPALVALLLHIKPPHDTTQQEFYDNITIYLVYNFVLVILSVIFGTGVITEEVEQKTIVYLLTRPVPRWRILLMKYAATVTMTTLTVWLAAFCLALATVGPQELTHCGLPRDVGMLLVGALAYGGLFLLVATLVDRPLVFGLLYAFGWETWVPNLPGNFKYLSLMAYLRVLAPHSGADAAPQTANPFVAAVSTEIITGRVATLALLGVIVGALAAALAIFSVREYVPREEAA
jgi:ABC-2 type transport system permease protein